MDRALAWLYGRDDGQGADTLDRQGGTEASQLSVPDWINQIHELFPKETIERLERDVPAVEHIEDAHALDVVHEPEAAPLVENIVQATARDILCYAMKTLRCCSIVMHIHDEIVIEANQRMSLAAVCEQMGRTPPWAKGLLLRADGYETDFYKKD